MCILIIRRFINKQTTILHIGITAKSRRKFYNNTVTTPKHKVYEVKKKALNMQLVFQGIPLLPLQSNFKKDKKWLLQGYKQQYEWSNEQK